MATVEDLMSSRAVAVLDRATLAMMGDALDGSWSPDAEPDPSRREAMVAVARLRLYGDRQSSGWLLLTTAQARRGLDEGAGEWTVGFVPTLESFDDAPTADDVKGQARLFDQLDRDAAFTLAAAMLAPMVSLVVTTDSTRYKHQRPHDLPDRLEVIEITEAVRRLHIAPGEAPFVDIPPNQPIARMAPWWVPS